MDKRSNKERARENKNKEKKEKEEEVPTIDCCNAQQQSLFVRNVLFSAVVKPILEQ